MRDVFEEPVRSNIDWSDIESLLNALGKVTEGRGSRVRAFVSGRWRPFTGRTHKRRQTKAR